MIFFVNLSQIKQKTLKIDIPAIPLFISGTVVRESLSTCAAVQYIKVKGESNESLLACWHHGRLAGGEGRESIFLTFMGL
jgi:hypothetical protein